MVIAQGNQRPRTAGNRQLPCDGVAGVHRVFVRERQWTPHPRTRSLGIPLTPLIQVQPLLYQLRGRGFAAAMPRAEQTPPPMPCLPIQMNGTVLGRFSAAPGRAPLPVHGRNISDSRRHDGLRW